MTNSLPDIVTWAESPFGFFVDRHYQDGRWVFQNGPIVLASYHRDVLRHIFTPRPDGRLPYDQVAWLEPAKSGKSTVSGLVAQYAALHLGKNSTIVMAANTQNQAQSVMYTSLTDSIAMSPHLDSVAPKQYEVGFRNGNTVKAIPSNSRAAAGARFIMALFDELWGYSTIDAERLWAEFKVDPTRPVSLRFVTGYAGYSNESLLWQEILEQGLSGHSVPELEHITNPDGQPACWANGRAFTFWSKQVRQPWQNAEWLESMRTQQRPAQYTRMVLCEFAESEANFTNQEHWNSLIDPAHHPLPPGSPQPVYCGLDIAIKPNGDDCAIIGCYGEGQQVKIAFHHVWRGGRGRKNDLKLGETVQPYLLRKANEYNLIACYYDPSQGIKLADDLRSMGVRMVEVPQSHSSRGPLDTTLFEMVANRALTLYDHPDLRSMAGGAIVKELPSGMLFLQKAGGRAKIDLLIALAMCASQAYQVTRNLRAKVLTVNVDFQTGQSFTIGGEGLCQNTAGLWQVTYTGDTAQILERTLFQPGCVAYLPPDQAKRLISSRPSEFVYQEEMP